MYVCMYICIYVCLDIDIDIHIYIYRDNADINSFSFVFHLKHYFSLNSVALNLNDQTHKLKIELKLFFDLRAQMPGFAYLTLN